MARSASLSTAPIGHCFSEALTVVAAICRSTSSRLLSRIATNNGDTGLNVLGVHCCCARVAGFE